MAEKVFAKINGKWHSCELAEHLLTGRPGLRLDCTGNVVVRQFPEQQDEPDEGACPKCKNPNPKSKAKIAARLRQVG